MAKTANFSKQSFHQRVKNIRQSLRKKYSDTPHRSFRVTRKARRPYKLQGTREAWQLIIDSFLFLKNYRRRFFIIIVLYAVLIYFLVGGISQFDYVSFREDARDVAQGSLDAVSTAITLFSTTLLGGLNEPPNELQRFLSGILMILFWLAIVWLVRMISAGEDRVKIRDAFYNGPTPFVSTLVVLMIMTLQLLPAAVGLLSLTVALGSQWITDLAQGMAFSAAAFLLCLLSLYWISGTIIAGIIVALPGMYPFKALASARALINGKRWQIMARLLSVVIIQLLIWTIILLPVILLEGWLRFDWLPLVPITVQLLSGFTLVFGSVYLYKLYRSLL